MKKIIATLALLIVTQPVWAAYVPTTVEEEDGSPSVSNVKKIQVTNGTLTNDGNGVVSFDTGGGGGGSGDITAVGDVASGAAFDGTQGTTLTFNNVGGDGTVDYDGTDFSFSKTIETAGDLTVTGSDVSVGVAGVKLTGDGDGALTFLGLGNGSDEDFTLNLDDTSNSLVVTSSTGLTVIDFSMPSMTLHLGSAGVTLSDDGDGAITLTGRGNGSDEALTLNLDDTSNTGVFTSSTGLNNLTFTSIDLTVPTEVYDATNWDADLTVPTKDAIRDKIESISATAWTDAGAYLKPTTAGDDLRIYDAGGTDYIEISHDGTNVQMASANTTNFTFDKPIVAGGVSSEITGNNTYKINFDTATALVLESPGEEDLLINLTSTSNTVSISSTTGVTNMSLGAIGITSTGVTDLGGASSFEIPNGTNPTVDAEGEIAWETDDNDLHLYDGTRDTVLASTTKSRSFVIPAPVASNDFAFWQTPRAITITAVSAICQNGTNVIGQLQEYSGTATAPVDVDSDWTITTTEYTDTSFSNSSIDAGDWVGWKTTSVSGSVDYVSVTFEYFET